MDYILGCILGIIVYFICFGVYNNLTKTNKVQKSEVSEEKDTYWNFEFKGIDIAKITPRGLHDELIQKGFNKIDNLNFNGSYGASVKIEIVPYKNMVLKLNIQFENGYDDMNWIREAFVNKYSNNVNYFEHGNSLSIECNNVNFIRTEEITYIYFDYHNNIIVFNNPHVLCIMNEDEKVNRLNKYKDII